MNNLAHWWTYSQPLPRSVWVSLQLSCVDFCQIWTWSFEANNIHLWCYKYTYWRNFNSLAPRDAINHKETYNLVKIGSGNGLLPDSTRPLPMAWTNINSLRPSDAIWGQRSGSTLAQLMACCLMAPSHYLNQCWLITSKVLWHSSEGNFIRDTSATIHQS